MNEIEKKSGAIPLSTELIKKVKDIQLKLSIKENRIVTLTEASNMIVQKGLDEK